MRYLTEDQKRVLGDLGFRVLKTKADYYPSCTSQREYILVEIRENCLVCYTMRGRYGVQAIKLPGDATGEQFLAALRQVRDSDEDTDLQWAILNDHKLAKPLEGAKRT
jgi:hypothetical protein